MSGPTRTYSADYIHIEEALKDEWGQFVRLNQEIESFVPKSKDSFLEYRNTELKRLKELNPGSEEKELLEIVDGHIEYMSSLDAQFHNEFSRKLWSQNIKITTIAHALCEAQINAAIAIGLSHVNAVELFGLMENSELKKKWLYGPKSFCPSYSFPIGTGIHETLVSLIKHRNSLLHYKIELTVGDKKVLDGSKIRRSTYDEDRTWLHRYFNLPFDLGQFLFREIEAPKIMILFDKKPIEPVDAHAT